MTTEPGQPESVSINAVKARGAVRGNGVIYMLVGGTIAAIVAVAVVAAVFHFG